ncbi:MAG: amino acid ABC transporter permease [Spirochaetaceae bacterium]|jgi:putative glutamine transport system permease protein|nr:amino acid ABC transporter permease [Spirochaetaceae bacterium]
MNTQILTDIFTPDNVRFLMTGLRNAMFISVFTVALSVLFGTILAVCRNYGKKPICAAASVYIEIFRNTPLLLWILVCIFMLRFGTSMSRGSLALTLYTSSVIAEIMRGGLNSISKGQFEAARSQGFNFLQTLCFIILPQCFRRVVPSLMSQIITTVKDTSFLAQFAIAEFFFNAKVLMSSLPQKVHITSAHIFVIFTFVALVYFVINFSLSCIVRKLNKKNSARGH